MEAESPPPKQSVGDVVHSTVKAGLSVIPIAGGPLAELFSAIITPPLVKRRDAWIESLAQNFKALEEKVEGLTLESLQQNEELITAVMHALQVAMRNHQKEKLDALRNAVLNVASARAPDEDLQMMFMSFIDTMTPWHLRVIRFFQNPPASYEEDKNAEKRIIIERFFPEASGRPEFLTQVFNDLLARGLLESEWQSVPPPDFFPPCGLSTLGNQFLSFITSPLE